jgi:integrating conjugative element protein (TIGR03756 family)
MIKSLSAFIILSCVARLVVADTAPPTMITTPEIIEKIAAHYGEYTHYKVIGECQWESISNGVPMTYTTQELDEYLPDLIVTVFNQSGDNPWLEAATLIDPAAEATATAAILAATGYVMGNGHTAAQSGNLHADHIVMKEVDVIGNPAMSFQFPYVSLKADTEPFMPYYQSSLDLGGRSGTAELMRPESLDPFNYYIGPDFYNHWGYEFPRSMSVNIDNDYKASVVIALHAADIVTNNNALHTVQSTQDSCGKKCAVANVIEEMNEEHAIWQEVYPNDRHIYLGEDDSIQLQSLGEADEAAGNGNYVFVVWRHYQGCVQAPGNVVLVTQPISPTTKR